MRPTDVLGLITFNKPVYKPIDKYRDFKELFTGSEQGMRVFNELLVWGKIFHEEIHQSPIDPLRLAIERGKKNILMQLIHTIYIEPKERPTSGQRKKV